MFRRSVFTDPKIAFAFHRIFGSEKHKVALLGKYKVEGPPQTTIEKWAYFFREAKNLDIVPEPLQYPPIVEALDAARIATFTVDEWDDYIRAGMAIQNKRGMLSLARKEGYKRVWKRG